ncbi:MAG: CHAT domain-containing protein [Saprospiraceae bacterium]
MKHINLPSAIALLVFASTCNQPSPVPATIGSKKEIVFSNTRGLAQRAEDWVRQADAMGTERALPQLDSALAAYRTLKLRKDWVDILWTQCAYLEGKEDTQVVIDHLDTYISRTWWPDDGLTGQLYFLQGFFLRRLGRNYAAMLVLEKAKALSDQYGDVIEDENPAGPIYKSLANIKTRLGENKEAENLLREGLALLEADTDASRAIDNAFTMAEIRSDLGAVYQNANQPAKALAEYETGLQALPTPAILAAGVDGDMVYLEDYIENLADTKGMLMANKGSCLAELGRLPEAESYTRAGLASIAPTRISYRFNALGILAEIEDRIGRVAEVQQTREAALQLALENAEDIEYREVAKLLNTMGWAAYRQNKFEQAMLFSQKALCQIFPNLSPDDPHQNPAPDDFVPDPENAVAEALDLKGEAQWQLYQTTLKPAHLHLADSTTALAILMMENLRNAAVYESSKLGSAHQARALFGRMFRILYAQHKAGTAGAAARAFEFSEKSKAVLLHQKVSADAALKDAGVAESLLLQEHDLKEQWALLRQKVVEYRTANGKDNDTLNRKLYHLEDRQRALRQHIAQQYNLSPDGRTAKTATASDVQDHLLRSDETWLSYTADRDSNLLYIVAVDGDGVRMARRPYRDESVLAFLHLINDKNTADNRSGDTALLANFVRQSRRLYENLVQPVFPNGVVAKRLALSPDGALALLPFDVLLYKPCSPVGAEPRYDTLPYLARTSQARLSSSASLELFYAGQPRPERKGAYIGFAPDYTNSSLQQVKSGKSVVLTAEKAFEGTSYVGDKARLDSFRCHVAGHAILHFHGHAEAADSLPDQSWMAFSAIPSASDIQQSTNLLFAYQIYHMHIGSDLVLLSACRTGLGKIALGEGTMSLSRAFQAAGCPATVMSLWEVRDDATAVLMDFFLKNIHDGQDKDAALTNAKRSYLDSVPDVFPYYWAGFVLTGTSDPVRLTPPWWVRLEVWALAAGLLAGMGWWRWRRRVNTL